MSKGAQVFVSAMVLASALVTSVGDRAIAQPPDPASIVSRDGAMPSRWPRRLLAGTAMEAAGVLRLRDRAGLDGSGASVCVVDTGLDLAHRDFRDAEGRTRVSWLFDFTAEPRGDHPELEERFGAAVFRGTALDAMASPPGDSHGHGTAVASIAVGDDAAMGETRPGPEAGAAPGAALIVVKLPMRAGLGFDDALIARGTAACFSTEERERTVAVLAFGGHDGRHDGTEPLDVELDTLAADGARIVVAAGNDGGRAVHASATLGRRSVAPLTLFVPAPEAPRAERFVALSISGDAGLRATLHAPDGTSVGPVALGERREAEGPSSHLVIDGVVSAGARAGTGAIYVVIGGTDGAPFGGDYRLEVEARGRLDAWIVDADLGATVLGPQFTGDFVDPIGTVSVPGTAQGVITVGASIGRTTVPTNVSEVRISGEVNDVAPFSGTGPLPNAAPKPDLVAPAALVIAALSSEVREGDPNNIFGASLRRRRVGEDRVAVSGTSFAAPLVAGVLALGLGTGAPRRGDLDQLRFSAHPLGEAPWDEKAGFGVVDAVGFVEGTPEGSPAVSWVDIRATAPIDSGSPRLFLAGRAVDAGVPFDGVVELFLNDEWAGSVVSRAGLIAGPIAAPITIPRQTVTLEARIEGESRGTVTVRARIDAARERTPPRARGGGGCATTGLASSLPSSSLFLWLLTLFWVGQMRRGRH